NGFSIREASTRRNSFPICRRSAGSSRAPRKIGNSWTELSGTRQRALLTTLIDRIDVGADQIDIHLRPTRLGALLDVAATPLPSTTDDEIQILSIPVRLRRFGRAITMRIDSTAPFATAKPNKRLIKLLIRARRFNTALVGSDRV